MRASSAVVPDSSVRLWDLVFPADRALVARTRSAYIHLDNLIAYSKRDRDGKVHAYLACYRPDETLLVFFQSGEVVNAAVITPVGRYPVAIAEALKHLKAEPERSEIAFHTASMEQLASMYSTCAQPAQDLGLDPTSPKTLFDNVLARKWSGLLELISNGRVNYLTVKDGKYHGGLFSDQRPSEDAKTYLSRMFTSKHPEPHPRVTVQAYQKLEALPLQVTPALVQIFRHYVWDVVDLAEKEMPNDAAKRAEKIRARLTPAHDSLKGVGGARGCTCADPIVEPGPFAEAMAAWTKDFLGELDMIHPGIAPRLLKEATRAQRFQLDAVDFFDRLPWKIEW
jgi:hypothetical protein